MHIGGEELNQLVERVIAKLVYLGSIIVLDSVDVNCLGYLIY